MRQLLIHGLKFWDILTVEEHTLVMLKSEILDIYLEERIV